MKPKKFVFVLFALSLLALAFAGCREEETPPTEVPTAEPPPTVAPPTEIPATPTEEPVGVPSDVVWTQIQNRGSIVVGTSLDYPPFAFYNANFAADGFDIAMMRAIADKMGLGVEFMDFTFDGLINAMMLGQVHVAIGGISITPERREFVDFSTPYFISEAAVVAQAENTANISHPEELAGATIGVQNGSIYDQWLRQNLTGEEFRSDTSIIGYDFLDRAVTDLGNGHLDYIVMDFPPAALLIQTNDFVIAGQGEKQQYGIVVPLNEPSLLAAINDAISQLQEEGVIAELAETYMNLDLEELIPVPTPTPPPPATPTPQPPVPTRVPSTCVDGMAWVADVTYDDRGMTAPPELQPGQGFQKVWRVRNSGTCTWDSSYRLLYTGGNTPAARMSGYPVAVSGTVPPGAAYDFAVNLIAPTVPGTYQGFWELHNGGNIPFGQRIWVGIQVPGVPTPTPIPTQTPSPSINFYASRSTINAGESALLVWETNNVQAVFLYEQSQANNWQNYGVPGNASREVRPMVTTTYELRVIRTDGGTEIRNVTINVNGGFIGPRWRVNNMISAAGSFESLIPGTQITLFFNTDGTVNGMGGCNPYSGRYNLAGSNLTINITNRGSTSCGPEIDGQETQYLQLLAITGSFSMDRGWLYLNGAAGQTLISLRPD